MKGACFAGAVAAGGRADALTDYKAQIYCFLANKQTDKTKKSRFRRFFYLFIFCKCLLTFQSRRHGREWEACEGWEGWEARALRYGLRPEQQVRVTGRGKLSKKRRKAGRGCGGGGIFVILWAGGLTAQALRTPASARGLLTARAIRALWAPASARGLLTAQTARTAKVARAANGAGSTDSVG